MTETGERTVTVIGPSVKAPDGSTKFAMGPRPIPARLWEDQRNRAALVKIGISLYEGVVAPAASEPQRGPGRKSNAEKELALLREELAKANAAKAALEQQLESTSVTNDPEHATEQA